MSISLLLADKHPATLKELPLLIERESDIRVISRVDNRAGMLQLTRDLKPDIVVMETSVSGAAGYRTIRELRAACGDTRILVLSMYADHHFVDGMFRAGVAGYLLTDCAFDELVPAIRAVIAGQRYISPLIDCPASVADAAAELN
jgi:two-component system, NarL family, response regulator NreC